MTVRVFLPLFGLIACASAQPAADKRDSMFGSSKRTAGALIGILYDFKQDQKRQKTPIDKDTFERAVARFVDSGYDEGLLNIYYRVPRALYTTQLQIPTITADSAPKAFGVEKTVEPQKWMVHYKGQIAAPEDGAYRFLGDADDFVVVAINGKTVLVAEMPGTPMGVKWFAKEGAPNRYQAAGDWINFRAGDPVDIDIVTGESPGGQYRCMLAVQKRGGPVLPFQLSVSKETPAGARPWRGIP
ncbi:MAG: PA14 domain-containing protein [Verrucomicrobiota bacterium]